LAEIWKDYKNLPFAFAIWVGNSKVKPIEDELNKAFLYGINQIPELYNNLLTIDKDTFVNYLSHKIDYTLDLKKKEAIQLFTSMLITS
jgi:predicted solute-binding protein